MLAKILLLLTATPHQGNPAQFRNLLSLLDEHVFRTEQAVQKLLRDPESPWLLRRMKEDLRDFEARKLFVERHAYSEEFTLNAQEWALHEAVTGYINQYLPRQRGRKKQSAALARMVLQAPARQQPPRDPHLPGTPARQAERPGRWADDALRSRPRPPVA